MSACLLHLHALRPLHIGTGAADGAIDLPHSREAGAGYPNAPGSGLKGVIRDEFMGAESKLIEMLFGPPPEMAGRDESGVTGGQQGALMFSDGLLLCLPVRSLTGGFAWIASPFGLLRYSRERAALGVPAIADSSALSGFMSLATEKCASAADSTLLHQKAVYLQDLMLSQEAVLAQAAGDVADKISKIVFPIADSDHKEWRALFRQQFLVVSEAVFGYLCDMAMDVHARVRLKEESKTTDGRGLWYEESLPAESILWATVAADPVNGMNAQQVMGAFVKDGSKPLARTQLGGKETIGRGIVRCLIESRA